MSTFITVSILLIYIPKILFFTWGAWQYYRRWRVFVQPSELTPEEQVTQNTGRKFSGSNALLLGTLALGDLAWLAILFIIPHLLPGAEMFALNYSLWLSTNAGQMIGLFYILKQTGIIK